VRKLFLFLGTTAVAVLAVPLLNRWVDPFGEYYSSSAIDAAERAGCLISTDVVGERSWPIFKLSLVRRRDAETVVVGTSRSLKLSSRLREKQFANLAMPVTGIETLDPLFRRIHARSGVRRLTVYLGVELFWFNGEHWAPGVTFTTTSFTDQTRYLLARQTFTATLHLARGNPLGLLRSSAVDHVDGRCVRDRFGRVKAGKADAWDPDGSFHWRYELVPTVAQLPSTFAHDAAELGGDLRGWTTFDRGRLALLGRALALARSYRWNVVGFTPPYSTRYVEIIRKQQATNVAMFRKLIPRTFARNGFKYLPILGVSDVGCGEHDFIDDGIHPNAACARRLRRLLDTAARG
jgi:hypothetical protein